MEEDAGLSRDLTDFGDGLDGTDFILRVHDADEDGVGPDRPSDGVGVDETCGIDGDFGAREAVARKELHRLNRRGMFDDGRDKVTGGATALSGHSFDGKIAGFGAAAGEDDFV